MNEEKTIGELLKKYPEGFAVGPGGMINKTLMASSHFARYRPCVSGCADERWLHGGGNNR